MCLKFFNFNHTKVKTTLSNIHGINFGIHWLLDFYIITTFDDQHYRQEMQLWKKKNYKKINNDFYPPKNKLESKANLVFFNLKI